MNADTMNCHDRVRISRETAWLDLQQFAAWRRGHTLNTLNNPCVYLLSVDFLSIEQSVATAVDKCRMIKMSIRGCPLHFSLSAPLQLERQSSALSTRIGSADSDSHITHRQCVCAV